MPVVEEEPSYISIHEWQRYLGLKLLGKPAEIVYPVWISVNPNHRRLGNAQNVCKWTKEMEVFLLSQGIGYALLDYRGDYIASHTEDRRKVLAL